MNKKISKILYIVLISLLTTLAFFSANEVATIALKSEAVTFKGLSEFIYKLDYGFRGSFGINSSVVFILLMFFYSKIIKEIETNKRMKIFSGIIAVIFAIITIVGASFLYYHDFSLISYDMVQKVISLVKFVGYYCIYYYLMIFIINYIDKNKEKIMVKKELSGKLNTLYNKKPFLFTAIIILICWLPCIIVFYPGLMNADSLNEINQLYKIKGWSSHHPVVPTIYYGLIMKLGVAISDGTFGLFLSNIIQIIVGILTITTIINYIYSKTKNGVLRWILVLFFGLFPVWALHFYTEVKDMPYTIGLMLFIYSLMKTFISKEDKVKISNIIVLVIGLLLALLFRHNGLHIVLLTIPFMFFMMKGKTRKVFLITTITCVIFSVLLTKIITVTFGIRPGSKSEMLSIPLQQITYYLIEHQDELSEEELGIIKKVILIDEAKEIYEYESVDNVKTKYLDPTNDELKEFFLLSIKLFFSHPDTYMIATINSNYGYFYPNRIEYKDGIVLYKFGYDKALDKSDLNIERPEALRPARELFERVAYALRSTPFGILYSCGTYTLLLFAITIILMYYKKYKEILPLIPLYGVLFIAMISPVNAYVRYIIPIKIMMIFIICYLLIILNNKKESI